MILFEELILILLVFLVTTCYAYHMMIKSSTLSSLVSINNKINNKTCKKNLCVNGLGLGGSSGSSSSSGKKCTKCSGKGVLNCVTCGGKGIDKVSGSILERWTCRKCKGFGFLPCSCSGLKGLTPEQTGER